MINKQEAIIKANLLEVLSHPSNNHKDSKDQEDNGAKEDKEDKEDKEEVDKLVNVSLVTNANF